MISSFLLRLQRMISNNALLSSTEVAVPGVWYSCIPTTERERVERNTSDSMYFFPVQKQQERALSELFYNSVG